MSAAVAAISASVTAAPALTLTSLAIFVATLCIVGPERRDVCEVLALPGQHGLGALQIAGDAGLAGARRRVRDIDHGDAGKPNVVLDGTGRQLVHQNTGTRS